MLGRRYDCIVLIPQSIFISLVDMRAHAECTESMKSHELVLDLFLVFPGQLTDLYDDSPNEMKSR
jgi:hypothetical protein